jgi:transcription-repair coupling factor (superfamily II helicase)
MIDIYGKPPSETELLFDKRRIDILSKEAMVKSLVEQFNQVVITLKDNFSTVRGIGNMLFEILIPYIAFTRIVYKNHEFVITINKQKQWIKHVEGLLESLLNLCKTNNLKEE